MSFDTHPDAEQFQISLLRKASAAERLARACSLSETVIQLSNRAIRRANPELNEQELKLLFVEYCYGKDLSDCVRKYLMVARR
jgi:predicted ATP-dependent Lon-type protease